MRVLISCFFPKSGFYCYFYTAIYPKALLNPTPYPPPPYSDYKSACIAQGLRPNPAIEIVGPNPHINLYELSVETATAVMMIVTIMAVIPITTARIIIIVVLLLTIATAAIAISIVSIFSRLLQLAL